MPDVAELQKRLFRPRRITMAADRGADRVSALRPPETSSVLVSPGVVAVAASVYIAYPLEIIKLANPRIRRREEQARADARRSA